MAESSEEFLNEEIGSDESDNEEKLFELQVNHLENMIAENKFAYQPYLDLIKTFKDLGDLDRLRCVRKRMASQFPLSPELWIDWIQDEINLAVSCEEKKEIINLFEIAVKDYLSVELWLQYTTFCISFHSEENSIDVTVIKNIFEEALTAAGLHVTQGSKLWNSYIDYEKSILKSISKDNNIEYYNKAKLIANLYKRQLSCPLLNMEQTFEAFKSWLEENKNFISEKIIDESVVESIYTKTKEKLSKIIKYEEALVSKSEDLLITWKNYIEYEKSKEGSPVRVQFLYERFLCENCLNEEIWLDYINYVDTVLQIPDVLFKICKRAVRNCPWCCKIYQVFIKCLEKYKKTHKDIADVVEDAFNSGLQTAIDFRDIWLTYLEYLRRRFDVSENREEEEKRLKELRAAFSKALDFLFQMPDADPGYSVVQFWARIEAIYCKNMDKSRELWNIILADEKCKTSDMWLEYIHLERTFGDSKHLRKLFPRALQGTNDWPEVIGNSWLNYERDEGTLESMENCTKKISNKLKEINEKREKLAAENPTENVYDQQKKRLKFSNSSKKNEQCRSASKVEIKDKKLSGFKRKHEEEEINSSPKKKSKENEEDSNNKNDFLEKLLREPKTTHGETVIHQSSKDHRTVFVSNLDFMTEEDTIKEAFSSCGEITDLRLVRDYKGRSKGYCYVEFEKAIEAQRALKKDRELINGRPMFVSKCDPDKETRSGGFKYSSGMEKNKLFVRGLPFSTTVDELKILFSKFGVLKDVRLVTYRNGHSKGLAYVEFEDEASAAQAVLSTDGTTIENKQISVAISNPPERKGETTLLQPKTIVSLGGGPKEIGSRGRSKTQISFLPRALSVNKPNNTATESFANLSLTSPVPTKECKKLNNSDFRKLLG